MKELHYYLSLMYEVPTYVYAIFIVCSVLVWAVLACFFRDKKLWVVINQFVLSVTLIAILFITLLYRQVQQPQVELRPFAIFELAQIYRDVYNQMVLNVLLFFPLGLSLPFIRKNYMKHPVSITLLVSCVLSIVIEVLQYVFACGYSELDDVLLNIFGAFLGTLSYLFAKLIKRENKKGRSNDRSKSNL